MKINVVIRELGMESNNIDFNTFNRKVFGDETIDEVPVKAHPYVAALKKETINPDTGEKYTEEEINARLEKTR